MENLIEKAKQILHDADSGSEECKHYNNGFMDGVKFADQQLKNCNLQNVSESASDAFDRGFTAGYDAGVKMGLHSR